MNILVTGANGFVGKNLVENLKTIRDGKDKTHPSLKIDEIYEYTRQSTAEDLKRYCENCDFVFNLTGVNRPKIDESQVTSRKSQGELLKEAYQQGNCGFEKSLLECLKAAGNKCPVMLSSSTQATLEGRFAGSEYGKSKLAAEQELMAYGEETGAPVLVYRFPNLFGKWCRPNYNSAVATFCNAFANDLPYTVNDPSVELTLMYIDDVVCELVSQLEQLHEPRYVTHQATLGAIVELLEKFKTQPETLIMSAIPEGSFEKKLYSTYLSYLPKEKVKFPLKMNLDERGSFTELLKTVDCGQVSINISKPGITKGQHWHNSKWEQFIVVHGHGLIQERNIVTGEMVEFEVSGDKIEAVYMIPGWTHNIINLSETEDLVTVIVCNEIFNPIKTDTFFEKE